MDDVVTVARTANSRGEVVLRRRAQGADSVEELIVNGTFAMDSSETSSERSLAQLVIARAPTGGRFLVGGLGLGYTAAEILAAEVGQVVVVELEEALVQWAQDGITPTLSRIATDSRARLVAADVATYLVDPPRDQTWDGIVLDVDNGPDFLIHEENAGLYSPEVLRASFDQLAPGGRLAIWCQGPAPALLVVLGSICSTAREHLYQVTRGQRQFSYVIYTLDRPLATAAPPERE